jgi:hypothetical protein
MSHTEGNIAALARRYIDEILEIDETGPYLIGGNCRGAAVAVEIARQLQETGRQILLLTILGYRFWDLFRGQIYAGKVAFFCGINSPFNPYRRFRSPELGWRKLFPQGLRLDLLPWDHEFPLLSDQLTRTFVLKFELALDWAENSSPPTPCGTSSSGPFPETDYRATLNVSYEVDIFGRLRRSVSLFGENSRLITIEGKLFVELREVFSRKFHFRFYVASVTKTDIIRGSDPQSIRAHNPYTGGNGVNRRAPMRTERLSRSTWLVQICLSSDSPQTFFLIMLVIDAGE